MGIILGMDMGSGATKVIGINSDFSSKPEYFHIADPVEQIENVFNEFLALDGISVDSIDRIMVTGVGSSIIKKNPDKYRKYFSGINIGYVDEFLSNGMGAGYMEHSNDFIAISMGTGTSFVRVKGNEIYHIGGIGLGGGAFLGLSRLMLNTKNIDEIIELAKNGNLSNIDLQIKDISPDPLPGLPLNVTAASFGKISECTTREDIALGIIHLILQTIGETAVLTAAHERVREFIVIGNLTNIPYCGEVFSMFENLFGVKFIIPEYSEYRTALGAALCYKREV